MTRLSSPPAPHPSEHPSYRLSTQPPPRDSKLPPVWGYYPEPRPSRRPPLTARRLRVFAVLALMAGAPDLAVQLQSLIATVPAVRRAELETTLAMHRRALSVARAERLEMVAATSRRVELLQATLGGRS